MSHEASRTGAPRVAVALLGALGTAGCRTTILHRHGGPLRPDLDAAALRSVDEPLGSLRAALRRAGAGGAATRLERRMATRVLRRERPDLVWANTALSAPYVAAAATLGIPAVLYAHEQPDYLRSALARHDLCRPVGGVTYVGCAPATSEALADLVGVGAGEVATLRSPVDAVALAAEALAATKERLPEPDAAVVVAVGTGDHRKGVDVFVEAARAHRARGGTARWCWVGRRPEVTDDAVEWLGERSDAASWLARAAVVAVPSRAEAYPLVVMEAMAVGAAIVASDLPGIRDQVGDAGVLVPAGDATALERNVAELLSDVAERSRLGGLAAESAERFGLSHFADQVAAITGRALPVSATQPPDEPVRVMHLLWRLSAQGGISEVVRQLLDGVDPRAVHMEVLSARRRQDVDDPPAQQVAGLNFDGGRLSLVTRLRLVGAAARRVRSARPDVVQLHSGTAWLGLGFPWWGGGTRLLLEVHDAPGSGRSGAAEDRLEGHLLRWSRGTVLCHSEQVAAAVRDRWGVAARRVIVVPLAAHPSTFAVRRSPKAARAWKACHGVAADAFVVLAVGRLVPSKRFHLAVEAVAGLVDSEPEAALVLAGAGAEDAALQRRAEALGIGERVHLIGRVRLEWGDHGPETLSAAYGAADVVISTSAYEGFGLTMVEAMAAGVPVVAMEAGAVSEVVLGHGLPPDPPPGVVVPSGDVGAMVEALGRLADDGELRAQMGNAGRERAGARFSPEALITGVQDLYLRLSQDG